MKRFFKILSIAGIIGFVGLIVFGAIFINTLPGPAEIASKLKRSSPEVASAPAIQREEDTTSTTATPVLTLEEKQKKEKEETENAQLTALMDEDDKDIRVCENLGPAPIFGGDKGLNNVDFANLFGEEARKDPIAEALRIPIKAIFQDETVSSFMKDFMPVDTDGMEKAERDSFLDKLGFYSRATMMVTHLVNRKSDFETLGDRAIHMSVIARMASLKPDLANDPALRGACEAMENSIAQKEKVDLKAERQTVLELIKANGFTPKELNFDPDSYLKFRVKKDENNLSFSLSDKAPKPAPVQ